MKRREFIQNTIIGTAALLFPIRLWSIPKASLPNVLILGDSISIGYTDLVKKALEGEANVYRPMKENGEPWNCQGTTHAVEHLDTWLAIQPKWDVIHFNFGLHDLKHVDSVTGKNSINPNDPQQAKLSIYKKQLKSITNKLKATRAQCVFATTTPFPDKPKGPLRRADQPGKYNAVALKIMKKYKVPISDLNIYVKSNLTEWQIPNNVHYTKLGYQKLSEQVTRTITLYL